MFEQKPIRNLELLTYIVAVESVLLLVALICAFYSGINIWSYFKFTQGAVVNGILLGLAFVCLNYLNVNILPKYIKPFEKLKIAYEEVAPIAANVKVWSALIIAIVSGLSEEIFFRGILLTFWGLIPSALIFGLFHIGSANTIWYGVYTVFAGLFFGLLYKYSGDNLLVPVIVHIINNFAALPYMKYYYWKNISRIKFKSSNNINC